MKFKCLIIYILLTIISLSETLACHKTGDSNCTPQRNSLSNSSDATDEPNHHQVLNNNYYDPNSDPKGFFSNDPYKKFYLKNNIDSKFLKNYSVGSSIKDINTLRSKEKNKNIISTEINKLSSKDLNYENVSEFSFLLRSIKDTISNDPSMSFIEKDKIINDIDNLRDTYLDKMQRTMLIKYDFGYFLSDLSKIISLPVANMKNKSSYLNKMANFLLGDINDQRLLKNKTQKNSVKFDEKVENLNTKIKDLDYINKLYVLLEPQEINNFSTLQQNFNTKNKSKLDKKEIETLMKSLNKTLKTNEEKINNYNTKSKFDLEKANQKVNQARKKIQDIYYVSKVYDLIGEKNY